MHGIPCFRLHCFVRQSLWQALCGLLHLPLADELMKCGYVLWALLVPNGSFAKWKPVPQNVAAHECGLRGSDWHSKRDALCSQKLVADKSHAYITHLAWIMGVHSFNLIHISRYLHFPNYAPLITQTKVYRMLAQNIY